MENNYYRARIAQVNFLLMPVFRINSFSIMNKKVAQELRRDRFIYQDQTGLKDSKKSNKRKKIKFAILLDGLFIYFSLVIEPFRISASLIPF